MQWSCPHCGISLSVNDEMIGAGWSFSRCYKCGGFALIRRAEINIIKVDKAPPGERIILPEAPQVANLGLESESATQKMAKHIQQKQRISVGTPPTMNRQGPPPTPYSDPYTTAPQHIQAPQYASASQPQFPPLPQHPHEPMAESHFTGLPRPLPELPELKKQSKAIPLGISATGVLAVMSGVYLYVQAQSLWSKTRDSIHGSSDGDSPSAIAPTSAKSSSISHFGNALNVVNAAETPSLTPSLTEANSALITDQVQQSAMAPIQPSAVLPIQSTALSKAAVAQANPPIIQKPAQTAAHAPAPPASPASLLVRLRGRRANLHSGPGTEFPIIGSAASDIRYRVTEWNDRWFRLNIDTGIVQKQVGWVRNDMVEVLREPITASN